MDPMLPTGCEPTPAGFELPATFHGSRAALVVAHPGHELRVYGWLSLARPTVFVLTDGSGHTGLSRLGATTALIEEAGAERGCLFGRFTDRDIYKALLGHDSQLFKNLAEELASALIDNKVRYVVGDAIEGYNPVHDVCRTVINAAVRLARRRVDYEIDNLDFLVVGDPARRSERDRGRGFYLRLNESSHTRKLKAAAAYSELSGDVDQALASFGAEAFQGECLYPVSDSTLVSGADGDPPFYEQYGEKQVAAGYYDCVVRYREHMLPLFLSLNRYAEQ